VLQVFIVIIVFFEEKNMTETLRSATERISKGKVRVKEMIDLSGRAHAVLSRYWHRNPQQYELMVLGAVVKKELEAKND